MQKTKIIKLEPITNGCISKPGCNSQIIYILPYLKTKKIA